MLSLGVSFADVSISGSVNQTIGSWNDSGVMGKGNNKFSAIGDRNLATGDSLITFAGSEELGDGLKASFKFEPRINISGSDTSQSTQKGTSAYLLFGQIKNTTNGTKLNANAVGVVHNF